MTTEQWQAAAAKKIAALTESTALEGEIADIIADEFRPWFGEFLWGQDDEVPEWWDNQD